MEWYVLQALTGREQDARAALERAGFDAPGADGTAADPQAGPVDRTGIHAPAGLCIR